MRQTLAVLATSLIILTSSGCGNVDVRERALAIEEGAIMKEGILKGGLNVEVKPGAVQVQPGAFTGPAFEVKPNAIHLEIAQGAIQFHENSININLMGKRKGPWIDTTEVKAKLQEGLAALPDLQDLSEAARNRILQNEAVYQAVVKALLKAIDTYNLEHAEPLQVEE